VSLINQSPAVELNVFLGAGWTWTSYFQVKQIQ